MTTRPRFSVVIPAYNEEAYLGRCLDSLAAQCFSGLVEVIVVNNNSSDRTAEVALAHGVAVLFEPAAGVCQARQTGTAAASGEIVVSTDADTVFGPGWLARIDRILRADPDAVAVAGPCQWVGAPGWGRVYQRALFGGVDLVHRLTGRVLYVSATNIAFRREHWTGYDLTLTQGGDELDLLRRLRSRGPVRFDRDNPTFTSARRMNRGLFYNLFCTFLYYYLVGYLVNRLFRRRVLGMAPAFRDPVPATSPGARAAGADVGRTGAGDGPAERWLRAPESCARPVAESRRPPPGTG